MREKKGKDPNDRFKAIFDDVVSTYSDFSCSAQKDKRTRRGLGDIQFSNIFIIVRLRSVYSFMTLK